VRGCEAGNGGKLARCGSLRLTEKAVREARTDQRQTSEHLIPGTHGPLVSTWRTSAMLTVGLKRPWTLLPDHASQSRGRIRKLWPYLGRESYLTAMGQKSPSCRKCHNVFELWPGRQRSWFTISCRILCQKGLMGSRQGLSSSLGGWVLVDVVEQGRGTAAAMTGA
jgi:hypothetical protein